MDSATLLSLERSCREEGNRLIRRADMYRRQRLNKGSERITDKERDLLIRSQQRPEKG